MVSTRHRHEQVRHPSGLALRQLLGNSGLLDRTTLGGDSTRQEEPVEFAFAAQAVLDSCLVVTVCIRLEDFFIVATKRSLVRLTPTNNTRRNHLASVQATSDYRFRAAPMRRLGRSRRLYNSLVVTRRLSAGAIPVLSAAIAIDAEGSSYPLLAYAGALADDWAWLGILLCSCAVAACAKLLTVLGNPSFLAVVEEVLDRFREGVFGDDGDLAHHRVTLFKHHGFHLFGFDIKERGWPLSGWLVPVARSGHTAQKTSVRFLAPHDTDRAQGIAGRAWAAASGTASAWALPDIRRDTATSDDVRQYAEQTNVTGAWVKKRSPGSRALMGFTIETPSGVRWGVLVVDSREPDLDLVKAKTQYHSYGRVLGRLVEEM